MRVLLVVHGFPPRALGGTEVYAEAHAQALASVHGDTVLVIAREDDPARPELQIREEVRGQYRVAWVNHTFRESTSLEDGWRAPRVARALAPVIDAFRPEVAHVHHLTCLSTLIPSMLAARGVPVVSTLHDYWLICQRGQLLDLDGARCDGPGVTGCSRCFAAGVALSGRLSAAVAGAVRAVGRVVPGAGAALGRLARRGAHALGGDESARTASLERTRHIREEVLPHVDLFLAPCAHVRDRFLDFGVRPERIRVAPLGLPERAPVPRIERATGPLRAGYLGSLMLSKAPHVAMDAVARLPAGTATLDVCGAFVPYHGDRSYGSTIERSAQHPAITMHGAIAHDRVPDLLASLDVLVVPSVWEENSPLVILEAFRAGLTVVASRVGGIPELVEHDVNGLLVEPGDTAAVASALGRLAFDRACLARLRSRVPPVRSLADAVQEVRTSYELLLARGTARLDGSAVAPSAPVTATRSVAAVVLHYGTRDETAIAVRALRACDAPLDRVVVVDNDDAPGRLDLGTMGPPIVDLVMGRNAGFAGGMNAGIRAALEAGADAVLLVNSDVVVPPETPATLARALDAHPRAGVVAPVVLVRERPDRVASRGIRFHRATGRTRNLGMGEAFGPSPGAAWRGVDAVNGAVMLVAREVFERAGWLDEEYFFSFEEIDLCARVADAGFEIGVTEDAVAYHRGGASQDPRSVSRFYYGTRNQLRLAARAGRPSGRMSNACRATIVVALNVAHAFTAPGGRRLARLAATARGVRDYRRGRFGPEPRS